MSKYCRLGIVLIIFLFSVIAFRHLFLPGYFPIDDNTQMMRLYQMENCLRDGQFPCRLVRDLGNGYTFPLFNYYSPFVYYLGVWGRLFNLPYLFLVKALFFLSVFLSGLSFYYLVRKIFNLSTLAALVGSFFYIFVPYRSVDIYVRGDLAESWTFVFLPLVFGMLYDLAFSSKIKRRKFIVYNLILAAFFITHTVSLVMAVIPLSLWLFYLFFSSHQKKKFFFRLILLLPSLGLASFYLLPALGEKSLVTTETMFEGYFNYLNHFVSLKQLFWSRYWGYGGSNVLDNDTMSFQLGWPHWWLVVAYVALVFAYLFYQKVFKLKIKNLDLISNYSISLVVIFLYFLSVFLTHAKSYPLWKLFHFLKYLQFPWRFLLLAVFFQALIIAFLFDILRTFKVKFSYRVLVFFLLVGAGISLNLAYFRPETIWPQFSDKTFFQPAYFKRQQQAIINDYLPKKVRVIPRVGQFNQPVIISGKGEIKNWQLKSNYWHFQAGINKNAVIMIPVFDFPRWQVVLNGKPISHQSDVKYGFIEVSIAGNGTYDLQGFFLDTPIRKLANDLSLFSLIPLIGFAF